jgi:copper resistance protein D
MSWFGAEIDGPMVVTRAIHFAATATTAGALMFRGLIAEPALRAAPPAGPLVHKQICALAWIGLATAVVSGPAWVLLLTMSLSDEGLGEAVMSGALRDVVNLTQFGLVSEIRSALAIALAICLAFERLAAWRWLGLAAAVLLAASIAWTGHAASTPFTLGYLHLASDALHLTAASAWIGGLVHQNCPSKNFQRVSPCGKSGANRRGSASLWPPYDYHNDFGSVGVSIEGRGSPPILASKPRNR